MSNIILIVFATLYTGNPLLSENTYIVYENAVFWIKINNLVLLF